MSFSDLLKQPLPSKIAEEKIETESADEETLATEGEDTNIADTVAKQLDALDNDAPVTEDADADEDEADDKMEEDLDAIDLSGLSDEELDEMEEELRDSDLDDAIDEDIEPVTLSAEEEREADDLMALASTTELLRTELTTTERAEFLESARDTQIAVFEGFLLESDVTTSTDDNSDEDVMTEAYKRWAKTSVRFSDKDRKAQLYAVALNVSARAHNDPDYVKLQRVQKMRRILKRKIQRKYHAEAIRRMKIYFNRLRSSKSSVLSNLAKKIDGPSGK